MKCRFLFALVSHLFWMACGAGSTNTVVANSPEPTGAVTVTNDPVELEYQKLLELDDAAATEVDGWILENQKFEEHGAGVPRAEFVHRIQKRRESVRSSYEDFIKLHPNHARARLAFASFLEDSNDLSGALEQMLKAKEVEPANPAAWNNLATYYGHYGDITNAFFHYEKAIELNPQEPGYYQNFGTTVFLFRKDVRSYYGINEQQVFDKALTLYSNAVVLNPTDFLLATDVAMTYYGIQPPRHKEAARAWNHALQLAEGSLQREGVLIHLGRIAANEGRFAEARTFLNSVTNAELAGLRDRVLRNLVDKEAPATTVGTNAPPAATTNAVPPAESQPAKPAAP